MPAERIDSLTGLRFFAALGILVHHFGNSLAFGSSRWLVFFDSLSSCVSFFFVLSGFILVHSYRATSIRLDWARFMVARFARIYPLYLVALAIMAVPFLKYPVDLPGWKSWESVPAFLASLLSLQAWIPRYSMLFNSPGWSLSAEMFFYAMFPLVAWHWRRFLFDRPLLAMSICWGLSNLAGVALELAVVGDRSVFDSGAKFSGFNPLVRFPEFLMGMSLASLHSRKAATGSQALLLWSAGMALLLAFLFVGGGGFWKTAFHNGLLSPLFCMVILGLARSEDPFRSLLERPLFRLLGESSYALYILHFPFMIMVSSLAYRLDLSMGVHAKTLAYIALSIALSVLAHLLLERPAQAAIRARFLDSGPSRSAVQTQ